MVVICHSNKPALLCGCHCHGNRESRPHFSRVKHAGGGGAAVLSLRASASGKGEARHLLRLSLMGWSGDDGEGAGVGRKGEEERGGS